MSGARIIYRPAPPLVEGGGGGESPLAAINTLEVIMPRQAGTSPSLGGPTFPSGHRHLWAYPGDVYEIQAYIRGGMPPYV